MSVGTIPALLWSAVTERPRPDCLAYREGDGPYVRLSSDRVLERVRDLSLGLRALGVGPGDRVAILSENRYEWALADLAALACGAVTVPIYATLLAPAIQYILADCGPVAIFLSTPEQAAKFATIRGNLPTIRHAIAFDAVELPGALPLARVEESGGAAATVPAADPAYWTGGDTNGICSIIYTSGTTGNPKGVVLTHRNFVSNIVNVAKVIEFYPTDSCLSFLPLSHVLERMAGYYSMLHFGVGIYYARRFDTIAEDLAVARPTIMISVPRLYEKIHGGAATTATAAGFPKRQIFFWARRVAIRKAEADVDGPRASLGLRLSHAVADRLVYSKLRAKLGGRIRIMVSGGAPLNARVIKFFHGAGALILEGYGLTETSPVLSANLASAMRFGSVGKPIPETEIRIAGDGEILCRGPQVMKGYYRNDAATAEVLDADGWLATGDIGHVDADGYVFITDRKKELIVTSGGKNIAPQPMEGSLAADKYIAQAVVIGDRRPYLSALIVPDFANLKRYAETRELGVDTQAGLVQHPRVQRLYQRIIDSLNEHQPSFGQIKRFTLLPREFTLADGELTPTLKVKRFEIGRAYKAAIDAMYPVEAHHEDE
ncbi:MAG: long-chain fatty acid--CoA ligase [bacterium]|nr:long-chain fatty acid--CoA ligase [bacterium]